MGDTIDKRPPYSRGAKLTLAFALVLVGLSAAQLVYRFSLPTDGWSSTFYALGSNRMFYIANLVGLPSDLEDGDIVVGLEGQPIDDIPTGVRPDFWVAGQTVDYTVLRDEETLTLPVPLGHWTVRAMIAGQVATPSVAVSNIGIFLLFAVSLLAFLRRPNEPAAQALLVFAASILANSVSGLIPADYSVGFDPLANVATGFFSFAIFGVLIAPALLVFTLVFPRPKPIVVRHPWLVAVPFAVSLAVGVVLIVGGGDYLGWVTTMVMMIASLVSLFHSAVTMRDAISRAQLTWAIGGLSLGIGLFLLNFPSVFGWVGDAAAPWFAAVANLGIPVVGLGLAVAVLRYRLFDIDVIIRRTTTYAILTALLALVYFGSVVLLQRLLSPFTGESKVAVVLSTLFIAALFMPLRRRVQVIIDRRFFRKKYDAEQVLNRFAATVRDETDLDALTTELVRVIQEAMQPEHVSVWLKPSGNRSESAARRRSL